MFLFKNTPPPENTWSFEDWSSFERRIRARAEGAASEKVLWRLLVKEARTVMRAYTTSFFIVSRFLPPSKRAQVEAIYAAVRYPDEIVDTFPLSASAKTRLLDEWQDFYEIGLEARSIRQALDAGVPCFLAAFTKVVRENSIPAEYYRSFLDAMRRDAHPQTFRSIDDLIENYVYGSAVVVGYFLSHVYGAKTEADFPRAMKSSRSLGIALQLTNFLRDVSEDQARGRIYLPLDMLRDENIECMDVGDERQHEAISRVIRRLAGVAETFYAESFANLDAFAPDCRTAIHACIKVYRRLNERIASSSQSLKQRESVPLKEKVKVLPASKYWRIPFAYLIR
jgi:phytoene synthase